MSQVNTQTPVSEHDDPQLQFTEAAIKHIKRHLDKHPHVLSVRFSTKVAGCSGIMYVVDFIEALSDNDAAQHVDSELTIYIEKKSIPFVKGSTVDYVWKANKLSYEWEFTNPNASASCGCGESFTV